VYSEEAIAVHICGVDAAAEQATYGVAIFALGDARAMAIPGFFFVVVVAITVALLEAASKLRFFVIIVR